MYKEYSYIRAQRFSRILQHTLGSQFITHITENNWGGCVLVMEKNGKAFSRTYFFNNDNNTIYFDTLSVSNDCLKEGIATELLNAHIKLAKILGSESWLWVKKETWVHEWYKRKGYADFKDYEGEDNSIWMKLDT